MGVKARPRHSVMMSGSAKHDKLVRRTKFGDRWDFGTGRALDVLYDNRRTKMFIPNKGHGDPLGIPLQYMSEAEFEEEVNESLELANKAASEERTAFCMPNDFSDPFYPRRLAKAVAVNLYVEYGGDWAKVWMDERAASRSSLALFMTDDQFRAKIYAADEIVAIEAKGVVVGLMRGAEDEKTRLTAALRFLEYRDGRGWDRGVRKQIVANKGALQQEIFKKDIPEAQILEFYLNEKLQGLDPSVRQSVIEAFGSAPTQKPKMIDVISEGVPMPGMNKGVSRIAVANIADLTDPFSDEENK